MCQVEHDVAQKLKRRMAEKKLTLKTGGEPFLGSYSVSGVPVTFEFIGRTGEIAGNWIALMTPGSLLLLRKRIYNPFHSRGESPRQM